LADIHIEKESAACVKLVFAEGGLAFPGFGVLHFGDHADCGTYNPLETINPGMPPQNPQEHHRARRG